MVKSLVKEIRKQWRETTVKSIHKEGQTEKLTETQRGISVNNVISKEYRK